MRSSDFSLDLRRPLSTAKGTIDRREGVLVGVEINADDVAESTDSNARIDAVRGLGEATPLPGWTESLADCRAALTEAVGLGDPERALSTLDERPRETPAARHAVSLALADARARASGQSLAKFLTDSRDEPDGPAERVPVNATVGDGSVEETVDAAESAVTDGFDCLKVKAGARPLEEDVERLRAVRDAVGDGVTLRVDANAAWSVETARDAIDTLAELDVAYVEQPLPADDLERLASLRGRGVAVAVDETLASHELKTVLDADAADVAILKPMALGGPDRAVVAAERARDAGVTPVVTTTIDAAVARTAAVHVAAAIPDVPACGLATGDLLADDFPADHAGSDPVPVEDGSIAVPTGAGNCGSHFDELVWNDG